MCDTNIWSRFGALIVPSREMQKYKRFRHNPTKQKKTRIQKTASTLRTLITSIDKLRPYAQSLLDCNTTKPIDLRIVFRGNFFAACI